MSHELDPLSVGVPPERIAEQAAPTLAVRARQAATDFRPHAVTRLAVGIVWLLGELADALDSAEPHVEALRQEIGRLTGNNNKLWADWYEAKERLAEATAQAGEGGGGSG